MPTQTDTIVIDPAEDLPALVAQQVAEIERLRAALKPFADRWVEIRKLDIGFSTSLETKAMMDVRPMYDAFCLISVGALSQPAPQPATPELSEYAARMVKEGKK